MRRSLWSLAVAVAVAVPVAPSPAAAQPACVAGTLAEYIALGELGCVHHGVQFRGFTLPVGQAWASEALLTPTVSSSEIWDGSGFSAPLFGVGFDYSFTQPFQAVATHLNGAEQQTRTFSFTAGARSTSRIRGLSVARLNVAFGLKDPPPLPWNYAVVHAYSPTSGADACAVRYAWCFGAESYGRITAEPHELPTTIGVDVGMYLEADVGTISPKPGDLQYVDLRGVRHLVVLQTPEPATFALLGGGLLLVGAMAWRRARLTT